MNLPQSSPVPVISVVMPAFNAEQYIQKAVDSILNQSYEDFELLICDDNSNDATNNIIESITDHRVRRFINDTNEGYLKTVNKLFSKCRGEFIVFQDADDWSSANRLEKQLYELRSNSSLVLCGTNIQKIYSNKSIPVEYPPTHTEILKALENGHTALFCGASIMFRRVLLNNIGSFREFFNKIGAEDIDWYLRAVEKYAASNISEPLYYYRQQPESISRNKNKRLLSYFSTDIALALHIQRTGNIRDVLDLNDDQGKSLIINALAINNPEITGISCAIMEQAAFSQLAAAIHILLHNHRKLGLGASLFLSLKAAATYVAINALPTKIIRGAAAKSRLKRAMTLAATINS